MTFFSLENYELSYVLLMFIIIYFVSLQIKPNFLFTSNGTFREFGVGYAKKTVVPIWLFTIFIAIFSYLCIKTFIIYPKITQTD